MKKPRKKKGNQGKGWGKHVPLRTERQKRILLAMQIDPDFCYLVRQKMAKFYAPIEAKKNTGLILEYWGKRIQADPKAQAMQALEISTGKMVIGPERMLTEVIFPVERKGAKQFIWFSEE